jgi:hypothetical protein
MTTLKMTHSFQMPNGWYQHNVLGEVSVPDGPCMIAPSSWCRALYAMQEQLQKAGVHYGAVQVQCTNSGFSISCDLR